MQISIGDIALIKEEEKHMGKWNIGIVEKLYQGKDGVIRATGLKTSKSYIEHPIQYLYLLELHCDIEKQPSAAIAEIQMTDVNDDESKNDHQQQ